MSRFIAIAGIRLEHDYYTPPINSYFSLMPTSQTDELMKRRGVLFRQTAINEWQWLVEEKNAGFMESDILEVSIIVDDPDFLRKILVKKGYDPRLLYQIRLGRDSIVEFNPSPIPNETKRRGEFCRIVLKPIQAVIDRLLSLQETIQTLQTKLTEPTKEANRAEAIKLLEQVWQETEWLPMKLEQMYTIKFCTCSYYWEFLLVFKDKTDQIEQEDKFYVLETNTPNKLIVFHPSEKYEDSMLGNIYRIISEVKIEAKECYDFTLTLYECSFKGNKRRVISKFISIPQPGKYIASRPDILREVCYL